MAVYMEMIPDDDFPDDWANSVGENDCPPDDDSEDDNDNPPYVILHHNWTLLSAKDKKHFLECAKRRGYKLMEVPYAAMLIAWESKTE